MDNFSCGLTSNQAQLDHVKRHTSTTETLQKQIAILTRQFLPRDGHDLISKFIKATATEIARLGAQTDALHFQAANSPFLALFFKP